MDLAALRVEDGLGDVLDAATGAEVELLEMGFEVAVRARIGAEPLEA